MDTKSQIIDVATLLFQQKGYKGVGLTEIIKTCNISKGSFYHHFPNGKEECLIACLRSLSDTITGEINRIFNQSPTTHEATKKMIEKLVGLLEVDGTIAGYTFTSIVSGMGSEIEPVRTVLSDFYLKMQKIYTTKLETDGFSKETAHSNALMMTASIEGAILLCMTQKTSGPLKTISQLLTKLLKEF
ncbi:TetR/AcrR family transcriptional regulator [Neobacillus soli]|uniref:TetR/AcrR family transcriptional regulator n=1 Tax=Neobacillus soli TaxID=220688 RepID=UPI000825E215|nr:TetR/AcrR family transcriptional regulator [Neobacillus soli]